MSPFAIVLLLAAAVLLAALEWPRLAAVGQVRARRQRERRKSRFHVVEPEDDDFARSVERDLAALPTIDEQDATKN